MVRGNQPKTPSMKHPDSEGATGKTIFGGRLTLRSPGLREGGPSHRMLPRSIDGSLGRYRSRDGPRRRRFGGSWTGPIAADMEAERRARFFGGNA